jgi:hypothetical protein
MSLRSHERKLAAMAIRPSASRWNRKRIFTLAVAVAVALLFSVGVLGQFNLLPAGIPTFLAAAPQPLPDPPPPQLSREYLYAGSKLLAVEDAGAQSITSTELAVYRLSSGNWYVLGGNAATTGGTFGLSTDKPAPGDYDGDGKTDFCVFRPAASGAFYSLNSSDGTVRSTLFGTTGDVPAPGDYDGDGRTDIAVYRPSTGVFYALRGDGALATMPVGTAGDIPAASDYDGDGREDGAVFRNSNATFYVLQSSTGATVSQVYGLSGDIPVPGDYDGDGKSDFTVFRTGNWYRYVPATGATVSTAWGLSSDNLVQGDYDADGKTDIAVWRGSTGAWYILNSSNGLMHSEIFGQSGDVPVPAPYRR